MKGIFKMTNAQIILSNSIDLMKKGILNGTGKFFEVIDENGKKITIEIPEEIHTFQAWKSLGYCVKKGERAVCIFPIWKCVENYQKRKNKNNNEKQDSSKPEDNQKKKEEDNENSEITKSMFMKNAHFFKASQIEKIKN